MNLEHLQLPVAKIVPWSEIGILSFLEKVNFRQCAYKIKHKPLQPNANMMHQSFSWKQFDMLYDAVERELITEIPYFIVYV